MTELWTDPLSDPLLLILIVFFSLNVIALILLLWNGIRFRKMSKKILTEQDQYKLKASFQQWEREMAAIKDRLFEHQRTMDRIDEALRKQKGHIEMVRYDAFNEGSPLSFSLAMLDDNRDGVVLTSIVGREESRFYGKPIQSGRSDYRLSPEEQEAIDRAGGNQEQR